MAGLVNAREVRRIIYNFGSNPNRTIYSKFPMKRDLLDPLFDAAISTFLNEPSLVEVPLPTTVFGDIHGQFDDLLHWFSKIGIGWPDDNKENTYLFLGDYVDRGNYSLETACLLLSLKVLYPTKVYLLRGNHEMESTNCRYGFSLECARRCQGDGDWIYRRINHVFACMPIAGLVGSEIFCMHGGLSPALKSLEQIRRIKRPVVIPDYGLMCDLLWSDPRKSLQSGAGYCPSKRGAGYEFGKDTCKTTCAGLGISMVIRAHQVPRKGYEFSLGSENEKILTIFSAPDYQGQSNEAAVVSINKKFNCVIKILPRKKK